MQEYYTPEEYLRLEDVAETKSEYLDGEIIVMSGASMSHSKIVMDFAFQLMSHLQGLGCQALSNDTRLRIPACNRYYYPDLMFICEPEELEIREGLENLLNPSIIVEVLSTSTAKFDRGDKLNCYKTIQSLQYYLLVSQDKPFIEIHSRLGEMSWGYEEVSGLEATLLLEKFGCSVKLALIYRGVAISEGAYDDR